jgi:hypothetical protein
MSHWRLMSTTSSIRFLSSARSTSFLVDVFPVYQSLKPVSSTSFACCPFHFVSWTQRIFTRRLIMISTNSLSLPVSDPIFQVPTYILLGSTSFLTLRIRRVKYKDTCSFFTTLGRRCSASIRMRWPDLYSLNTVSRSTYAASSRGWRSGPYTFNTIPGSDMTRG